MNLIKLCARKKQLHLFVTIFALVLICTMTMVAAATVYTPAGSPVTASYSTTDWDFEDWGTWLDARNTRNHTSYPSLVDLRSDCLTYNCHSYVWYDQGLPNYYGIYNPTTYMNDGSYNLVAVTTSWPIPAAAHPYTCKVYYGSFTDVYTHSGIKSAYSSYLVSKWGDGRLYSHYIYDCPNYMWATSISYWN